MMFKKIFIVLVLLFLMIWLYSNFNSDDSSIQHQPTKLETAGSKCIDISERSIASVTPILEFQKLELISRKSNVLSRCMVDSGYVENNAWRKSAEFQAVDISQQQKISMSEALETLRRNDMAIFSLQNKQPSYWISKK